MPLPQISNAVSKIAKIAAPSKGVDAISNLMEMDPQEAVYIYNMVATQSGLAVRPGWNEWCTSMSGSGGVRTIISVRGSNSSGGNDHLFACTQTGIYDCTSSSGAPTLVVTFGNQTGNAGWGEWDHCTNLGGDVILMYCDEVNGYYTFDTQTTTWTQVTQAFQGTGHTAGTTLTLDSTVAGTILTGGEIYTISGGVLTDTGFHVVSGSGPYTISGSPALAASTPIAIINNSSQIYGTNPANFASVRLFNNFVFFVQAGSSNSWILPIGQVYGVATVFSFGNKFPHGGNLNNLYVFTYGSYFGMYVYLVGIGDSGDIIAYSGTNPFSAASWTLSGQWYIGDMLPGRRNASNYGGDLTILSSYGIVNLSSLFYQKDLADPNAYLSKKVAPAIAADVAANQLRGWQLVPWPALNGLLVNEGGSGSNKQFFYNFLTNAWSVFQQTILMNCAAVWHGNMYAGTVDGRVVILQGGQDSVKRNGTGAIAINWGALGAFSDAGLPGVLKFVDTIRPYFLAAQPVSYNVFAYYDFNITDLSGMLGSGLSPPAAGTSGWDIGIWDSALWGTGAQSAQIGLQGVARAGRHVAVGILGASNGAATLIGYEASYTPTTEFL